MSDSPDYLSVLIVAGDARRNLGDEAILLGTCRVLRTLHPKIRISAVLKKSSPIIAKQDIRVIRSGLAGIAQVARAAKSADAILCGGGGLFQDDDSIAKMPYWALLLLLLRLCNKRIIGYSLGVGPLTYAGSRFAAKIAFFCLSRISVRDPLSQELTRSLTVKPVAVLPDPALITEPRKKRRRSFVISTGSEIKVGVAIRRWFPPKARIVPHSIAARYFNSSDGLLQESRLLCSLLADVLDRLAENHNARILMMPSYYAEHEGDEKLCSAVLALMKPGAGELLQISDSDQYRATCEELDVFLGGRMHPTIFAASVGTPIVGLAYNPKFRGFFQMVDVEDYVMDVVDFVSNQQVERLTTLVLNAMAEQSALDSSILELQDNILEFNRSLVASL